MRRAVFLDRDGVINTKAPESQYITRWEDFHFLPRVSEAITLLNKSQFSPVVVSNQRCVATGRVSREAVELIHRQMLDHLKNLSAHIAAVYFCPHDDFPPCACRKPAPGMLLQAANDLSLDLANSWIVGDSDVDIEAGRRAGCKTVRILRPDTVPEIPADLTVVSLYAAALEITSPRQPC